jgi:hypothetical protein
LSQARINYNSAPGIIKNVFVSERLKGWCEGNNSQYVVCVIPVKDAELRKSLFRASSFGMLGKIADNVRRRSFIWEIPDQAL